MLANFDTAAFGLTDPEGIAYDSDGGNLYVVGEPENRVAHFTLDRHAAALARHLGREPRMRRPASPTAPDPPAARRGASTS